MTDSTTPHPIALEQVLFTRVHVAAVPGHVFSEGMPTAEPENSIHVEPIEGEPGNYQAVMRTVINAAGDKQSPYCIDVECLGWLSADTSLPAGEARRGVAITAHSVLYGAIRETVAWLTARQPYGTLMLGLSVLRSPPKPAGDESGAPGAQP